VGALRTCVWITPESLQRRRPTPALDDLAALLRENSLGAAITVPRGSTSPTLLVVLGVKTNEWPCTYPEIRRLQNVAELMDNILTRSRFTDQAALQTRLEHLAMMSRGLAHDLKNLITPVSTFLIHTEGRYPADSAAAEVHAAAQRSVRIMTEYVREALFFADNLKPRMESVELENIFDRVREATAMRASDRGVRLAIALDAAPTTTADGVLLQRLLANLVNNAIDASTRGQLVRASAISLPDGQLRFQVVDEGVGIAPDLRARIFEPYFTTKEFGEEVRGFGLGLTIAQKIAHLHAGRISVESTPGKGTTFTVDLPPASPAGDSAAHPPTAPPAA
jgi:signal transduction histidine kinase